MATEDILSADEAEKALKTSAAQAVLVASLITSVSMMIDDRAGPVVIRAVTESHDGGLPEIKLEEAPVSAVTTVTEYSGTTATVLTAETNATKPAAGYLIELTEGRLFRRNGNADSCFASGRQNVVVVYSAGRDADTATAGALFKDAAKIVLKNLWRAYEDGVVQVDEFAVPRNNFPGFGFPNAARDMLDLAGELRGAGPVFA